MPQFDFQERAHMNLLSRIADTDGKRMQLQQEYQRQYRKILRQKKKGMVAALKERFNKLVQQENENLKERLTNITMHPDRQPTSGAATSYMVSPDDTMTADNIAQQNKTSTFGRAIALKHETIANFNEDSIEEEEVHQ